MHQREEQVLTVVLRGIVRILDKLQRIDERLCRMSAVQDALVAEAERGTTLAASIDALLRRIVKDLEDARGNPTAVQAVIDRLKTNNDKIQDAVVFGTEADPEAPPV